MWIINTKIDISPNAVAVNLPSVLRRYEMMCIREIRGAGLIGAIEILRDNDLVVGIGIPWSYWFCDRWCV